MSKITDIRTVLPRIVRASFKGFGYTNDQEASWWGWTPLLELATIVRMSYERQNIRGFHEFGLGVHMADDIFGRYGLLNDNKDGKPLYTWATISTVSPLLVISGERPIHPPVDPHFIHIPMGWAKNVIAAAEEGIEKITCELLDTGLKYGGRNNSIKWSRLIGHGKDNIKHETLPDGSGGYRYLPIS